MRLVVVRAVAVAVEVVLGAGVVRVRQHGTLPQYRLTSIWTWMCTTRRRERTPCRSSSVIIVSIIIIIVVMIMNGAINLPGSRLSRVLVPASTPPDDRT